MNKFYTTTLAVVISLGMAACSKSGESPDNNSGGDGKGIDNALHLSFKTPDWERKIDCTHLDLNGYGVNDSTLMVSAESASTKEVFYFSYPADSSDMAKPSNLKKYAIAVTGYNESPFEFSQKLPVTEGSAGRLVSEGGLSANSYNEVAEIKYIGRSGSFAQFQVKCRYSMIMHEALNESNKKTVTGTFHFKIKTRRI